MIFDALLRGSNANRTFKARIIIPKNNDIMYEEDYFETTSYSRSYGTGQHASTTWQVSSDVDFNNIVYQSVDDTVNLTTIDIVDTDIEMNNKYYLRVMFKSLDGVSSEWSNIVPFETYLFPTPINEWVDSSISAYNY